MTSVTDRGITESYAYDSYGRITQKVTKNGSATLLTETYTYKTNSSGKPTGQIATHKSVSAGRTVTYTYNYDANGNITSVSDGTSTTTYAYDSANQLIRENNQAANKTWTFSYDNAGNLTAWKEYAYTTGSLGSATATKSYTYGNTSWGDLLTAWNGNTITSDAIGNMLSDGTRTYTWRNGRELATVTMGGSTWTNTYDADGMRTKRTNGSTTYSYIYNGSQLSQLTVDGNVLNFAYDASGTPMAVTYGGTTYYYATNLQGDVVAILNSSGAAVVSYTYDAWGNILSTSGSLASTLGAHNPLRYRGYVYDHETGLYYLQSRYYNPEMGRFICADSLVSTGQGVLGNNMFAYCLNNPVSFVDESGCLPRDTYMVEISGMVQRIPPFVIPDNIYTKNSGLINGQAICPYAEETMGLGTYADNGCGIIAVYNSMQLLGKNKSLASIDMEIYIAGGYYASGLLGITLDSVEAYYKKHNISCTRYYSYSSMVASLSDGDVIVFMSLNNANNPLEGFHYMAAQYHSGQFVVYNPWSSYGASITTTSLNPVYGNARWFCGFIVGG